MERWVVSLDDGARLDVGAVDELMARERAVRCHRSITGVSGAAVRCERFQAHADRMARELRSDLLAIGAEIVGYVR